MNLEPSPGLAGRGRAMSLAAARRHPYRKVSTAPPPFNLTTNLSHYCLETPRFRCRRKADHGCFSIVLYYTIQAICPFSPFCGRCRPSRAGVSISFFDLLRRSRGFLGFCERPSRRMEPLHSVTYDDNAESADHCHLSELSVRVCATADAWMRTCRLFCNESSGPRRFGAPDILH